MSVITIFSGSYCSGEEIARKVAETLGYRAIDKEVIERASERFGFSAKKLARAMHGPPFLLGGLTRDRVRAVAYLQAAIAECTKEDNVVYHGFAGHLLCRLSNILRVCIMADRPYRIQTAMQQENLSEKEADKRIRADDKTRLEWTRYLFDLGPWDEKLYDVKLPMHTSSVEEAVGELCEMAKREALQTTEESRKAMEDVVVATNVSVALVEKGHNAIATSDLSRATLAAFLSSSFEKASDIVVTAHCGHVELSLNKYVFRVEHLKKELAAMASEVEGVEGVECRRGPGFRPQSRYEDLGAPPKVLLVDDEKEFVHTLSERLETRAFGPTIAYNGEEALSLIQKDEPEVMILDLRMPGIDGIEVLRRVKKEHPKVEIIILTGHGSEKDEKLARELGAFDYLQKPIDINKLTETLRAAHEKIRAERAEKVE